MIGTVSLVPIGTQAPDFTLSTIDGDILTLSQCRGKVVLLDFFATQCDACKAAMPHLKELQAAFPTQLILISISIVPDTDTVDALKQFKADYDINWAVIRDGAGISGSLYGVNIVPTLYILDAEGVIRYSHVGEPVGGASTLEAEIQALLQATPKTPITLVISLSTDSVDAGTQISISGWVIPAMSGRAIVISITGPDGSESGLEVLTSATGAFSTTFTPEEEGAWTFKASFSGDSQYLASDSAAVTLSAKQPFPILLVAGGAGLVLIVVVSYLVLVRKPAQQQPYPLSGGSAPATASPDPAPPL